MAIGVCMIVLVGLLWGVVGLLHSTVARRDLNFPAVAAISAITAGTFVWLFYVRWDHVNAGEVSRLGDLILTLATASASSITAFLLTQRAMRSGHHAGTWTIAQSAMIFPFSAGLVLWGDAPTAMRLSGVAVILGGITAFGVGRSGGRKGNLSPTGNSGGSWFGLALIAFVLLGVQQTLTQAPSRWEDWTDACNLRPAIMISASAVGFSLVALVKRKRPRRAEILLGLGAAAISVTSQALFYPGMDRLAAAGAGAVVYPLTISVCIVSFALYSIIVLREPTNAWHIIGLIACMAGAVAVSL